MKIAVVGGRDFEDYNKMQRVIESYFDDNIELWDRKNVIFVSGGAKGADHAFEIGISDPLMMDIYLPYINFNNKSGSKYIFISNFDHSNYKSS